MEVTVDREPPSIASCRRASTATVSACNAQKATAMRPKPAGVRERAEGERRGGTDQHECDGTARQPGRAVGERSAQRHGPVDEKGEQRHRVRPDARLDGEQRQVLVE